MAALRGNEQHCFVIVAQFIDATWLALDLIWHRCPIIPDNDHEHAHLGLLTVAASAIISALVMVRPLRMSLRSLALRRPTLGFIRNGSHGRPDVENVLPEPLSFRMCCSGPDAALYRGWASRLFLSRSRLHVLTDLAICRHYLCLPLFRG
jgi:hypothetical protein